MGVAMCRTPALTTRPQQIMEMRNPPRPTIIMGFRPPRSDWRAQKGELNAHSRADSEKIAATRKSGKPMDRPMAGRTDCMPVLPTAVTIDTPKMMAKDLVGSRLESGSWAAMGRAW